MVCQSKCRDAKELVMSLGKCHQIATVFIVGVQVPVTAQPLAFIEVALG